MAFSNPAVALVKPTAGKIPIVFVGVGDQSTDLRLVPGRPEGAGEPA